MTGTASTPTRRTHGAQPGERARTRAGKKRAYLPGLDGLRAIAVLAVCLFHFEVPYTQGGFLGVDVFFVISGYLITSQLWTRWSDSAIQLWPFWEARIRRLFPAVGAVLVFTSLAMLLWDRPGTRGYLGDLAAAATYTSNWWYVLDGRSYGVDFGLTRPPALQHLWSLAVEEQFYLVWPLLIAGGLALTRRMPRQKAARTMALPVALLAVASMVWMGIGSAAAHVPDAMNPEADPMRFYYGTDSHSMGLLLGAALALWRAGAGFGQTRAGRPLPRLRPAGMAGSMLGGGALAIVLASVPFAHYHDVWMYRYGFAGLALASVVLLAMATRRGPLASALSVQPLRWIGTRSYSIYLWHWPITVFTRPGHDLDWPEWSILLLRVVATVVAAELSYRLVEEPVRRHGFRKSLVWLRRHSLAIPAAAAVLGVFGGTVAVAATTEPATIENAIKQDISDKQFEDQVAVPDAPAEPEWNPSKTGGLLGTAMRPLPTSIAAPPKPKPKPVSTRTMSLTYYGDSFAVGAEPGISRVFKSVDLHAVVSRHSWEIFPEMQNDMKSGRLKSDVVLLHTGNNEYVDPGELKKTLLALAKVKRVIVVLPHTPKPWSPVAEKDMIALCGTPDKPKLPNVRVVNWAATARAHPEYMIEDNVHPNPDGIWVYTQMVQVAAVRP